MKKLTGGALAILFIGGTAMAVVFIVTIINAPISNYLLLAPLVYLGLVLYMHSTYRQVEVSFKTRAFYLRKCFFKKQEVVEFKDVLAFSREFRQYAIAYSKKGKRHKIKFIGSLGFKLDGVLRKRIEDNLGDGASF